MVTQFSDATRNAALDAIETTAGASPSLLIFSGAVPANCAAADPSGLLATITMPANWLADASSGSKGLAGTWQANASASGTPLSYRIKQGATCHIQGTCGVLTQIATNGVTAANSNVLNFAATTGITVGQRITGTGVLPDTYVLATTGTTVSMSRASTAGVSNGVSIAFQSDLTLDAASLTSGQQVTVTSFNILIGGA